MTLKDYDAFSFTDLSNPELAGGYLAELLARQELILLLGAGVSVGAGLPNWTQLVEKCELELGLSSNPGRSTDELMRAFDRIRRTASAGGNPDAVADIVRRGLYPVEYVEEGSYPKSILANPMLIAIGALVMSSARGSVTDVFTLNFDDLLEWYLHLHGFSTEVISDFPADLSGRADVSIFHPHGFVPLVSDAFTKTSWLVLSRSELIRRLSAGAEEPWPTLLTSRFMTKRLLAIGTSMNDLDIHVILDRAKRFRSTPGPVGFVVVNYMSEDEKDGLLEAGLVPVALGSHDAVPDFLLEICQRATAL